MIKIFPTHVYVQPVQPDGDFYLLLNNDFAGRAGVFTSN